MVKGCWAERFNQFLVDGSSCGLWIMGVQILQEIAIS